MRILILCENVYYNDTSAGIVNTNIINVLAKEYDIDCLYLKRYNKEAPLFFQERSNINLIEINFSTTKGWFYFLNKMKKVRAVPAFLSGLSARDRVKIDNWHHFTCLQLQKNKYSLIIALGTGHEFLTHFALGKLQTFVPKLLQIHDPFPLNVYPPPFAEDRRGIYKKLQKSFNEILKKTHFVGFPSELLKNWMQQYYDLEENQCVQLPHPETFFSIPELKRSSLIEKDDSFNIGHIGALWDQRDPTALIAAFEKFSSSDKTKAKFSNLYLLGGASSVHDQKWKNKRYKNIYFINKRISYKQSLEVQKSFTANIVLEVESEISPIMPGKLADCICVDRPIIALTPEKSETSRLLGNNYPYKTSVDDEEGILMILNGLWLKWLENKNLRLDRPDLMEHIGAKKILNTVKELI